MAETAANHHQYQLDHINDDKTPTIVAVYSLGYVLAATAVGLRFMSRKVSKLPYMWDDLIILIALTLFTALFGVDIWHGMNNSTDGPPCLLTVLQSLGDT